MLLILFPSAMLPAVAAIYGTKYDLATAPTMLFPEIQCKLGYANVSN